MKDINTIIIKSVNPQWLAKQELTLAGFKINDKKNQIQLTVAVTKDDFKYDKVGVSNVFEKFSIYPENIRTEQLGTLKLGKKVRLEKVSGVVTYGDFQNNLSITGTVQFYD
jgi:hypothetical protein